MKTKNDTGASLSSAFFSAWADSSIESKAKVTIEFGNNAFNSNSSTDQSVSSSSEKLCKVFDMHGTLSSTRHFWEPQQAFNNKNRNSMRWAVLDQGAKAWGPTSNYDPYRVVNINDTSEKYEHGWWSANRLSGSQFIQSIWVAARHINIITLFTDEAYPNMKDILVEYYDGASWNTVASISLGSSQYSNTWYYNGSSWIFNNGTPATFINSAQSILVSGLRVTVSNSYDANAHARISELQGFLITDCSDDVIAIQVEETREQYDTTVPVGVLKTASCTGTLQNVDQKYSASNISGPFYPYIGENNRIVVAFGVDTTRFGGSGFEYVNMGEFYTDQWQIDGSGMQAQFGTRDYGKFLQDNQVPFSKVWQNSTVNIPFRDLLQRSGKTPAQIHIDPLALRTFPLLYVYNTSYWNFMAEVALADQGTFGFDGNGDFFYYTFTQLLNPPYDSSMFSISDSNYIMDGSQTTNLVLNVVLVDVHKVISGDIGLQALFSESTTKTTRSKTLTSVTSQEASASTLSWNYLSAGISDSQLTIPVTVDNNTQLFLGEDAFGNVESPTTQDFYLLIEDELIYCTSVDHTHFYVYPGNPLEPVDPINNPTGRGWAGTIAAGHASGKYIGEAEYFDSVDYSVQPALSVTGVHCTAIVDLPKVTGIAQARLVKFNYDLFQAELCIANQVPCFTPLVGSGLPVADPAKLFEGKTGIDALNTDITLDWSTTIDGYAVRQRSTPRKTQFANLTNKRLIRRHGRAEIEINNPWIETQAHANQIAQFMISQYNLPRTMLNVHILGLPFFELSDRITISNLAELSIINRDFNIMNISYAFDGSLTSTISLREILS